MRVSQPGAIKNHQKKKRGVKEAWRRHRGQRTVVGIADGALMGVPLGLLRGFAVGCAVGVGAARLLGMVRWAHPKTKRNVKKQRKGAYSSRAFASG